MLNIVVALHCEARPLIDFFKLKKITSERLPFAIFTNTEQSIYLIVGGVGKIKTAAATTFLYYWSGKKAHCTFLNIGIAGSKQFSLGNAVFANKITEQSTARSWYPFLPSSKHQPQGTLFTYDLPQTSYPEFGMIDMEGAAFFQTATYFVTQEQIRIIKLISDNSDVTQTQLNDVTVINLIKNKISVIADTVTELLSLSKTESELASLPLMLTQFQEKWYFTQTQTQQLKEYLRRWSIRIADENPYFFCQHEIKAAAVIKKLMQKLETHANSLY